MSVTFSRPRFIIVFSLVLCVAVLAGLRFVPGTRADNASALLPPVTATDSVAVVVGNGDGNADPGETLEYTVTVNNGGTDATGVSLSSTLAPVTTFVGGSVAIGPAAGNDTYPQLVIGNVSINSANIPYNVLANDFVGQNPAATITAFDATSANGGQVVLNTTTGEFTYNPPAGFEGNDTFTYTLSNATASSVGTVSIPVSGMVWFINNNSPACTTLAAGCGRLSNPFSSLAAFQALNNNAGNNPGNNDSIFIFESGTTYSGGVTLLAGQRITGQDATATLAAITGLTPPSGSTAFPAMNTAGNATTLISGGVNVGGGGNTVRGMTISNTATAKIYGTNFGTLTVGNNVSPDVIVSGTGKAIDLNNGTFAATSGFTSVATTSSTSHGMQLISVGGTVAFGSTNVSGSASQGIFVNASNVNLNFGNTTVGATTAGEGVRLENNTGGTRTFGTLSIVNSAVQGFTDSGGGNTSVTGLATITNPANVGILVSGKSAGTSVTFANVSNTQSGSHGVHLLNNAGTVTFGDLDITADANQRGILATNNTGTITTTSGTISNTGTATAVEIVGTSVASRTPLNVQLTSVSATGSASGIILTNTSAVTNGFRILGSGGSCTSAATCTGGAIQNTTGVGVSMTAARNISLTRLFIGSTGAQGISGSAMSDDTGGVSPTFELANSRLTSPGDGDNESAIFFGNAITPGNVTGRIRVADTVIEQYEEHGLEVYNNTGTLTVDVTGTLSGLTDSTMKFDDNNDVHGQQGVLIVAAGTANVTSNVSGTYFNNIESAALDIRAEAAGAVVDVNWIGNVSRNGGGPDRFPAGGGFQIVQDVSGSATFDINNNNIRDCFCDGVVVIADGPSQGRINNNVISDTFDSGAVLGGDGIRIDTDQLLVPGPGPGNNFTATIQIQGNSIGSDGSFPGIGDDGIQILHRDGTKTLNLTIENNTIANTASEAIRHFQDADISDGSLRPYGAVRVAGNTMTNIGTLGPTDAFAFITQDTADLDLHVNGNTLPAAGNRNISLAQSGTSVHQITQPSVAALAATNTNSTASSTGTITFNSPVTNPPLPTNPLVARESNLTRNSGENASFLSSTYLTPSEMLTSIAAFRGDSATAANAGGKASVNERTDSQTAVDNPQSDGTVYYSRLFAFFSTVTEMISPTAYAQEENHPAAKAAPLLRKEGSSEFSGETVTTTPTFTIPANKSVVIKYRATVDNGPYAAGINNIDNFATISGSNFANVTSTTASIALDAAPNLSVNATNGSTETQPGVVGLYNLTYANATGINLQGTNQTRLSVQVPVNTSFNLASSGTGWSCADGATNPTVCTNDVGALAAGGGGSKLIAFNINGNLPATALTIAPTATIAENPANDNGTDLDPANNTSTDTDNVRGIWIGGTSTDWATNTNWSNNLLPNPSQNISVPSGGGANSPSITSLDVTVGRLVDSGKNVTIGAGRTLLANLSVDLGANNILGAGTLELASGAPITRTTGQVNCALKKNFINGNFTDEAQLAPEAIFTFPVGTATGFSPVTANVTAGSTGSLTVLAIDGTAPSTPALNDLTTLDRYWQLSETGDLTASLTFTYLQADVDGNEGNYRMIRTSAGTPPVRFPNGTPCPGAGSPCVDGTSPTGGTIFVNPVQSFENFWTAGEPLAPTASGVSISGRVLTADGQGIRNARIVVTGNTLVEPRYAQTSTFGYYTIEGLRAGETYVVTVNSRRFVFSTPSQVITVLDNVTDLDFTASPD